MLRKSDLNPPAEPGIYLFRTTSGKILYIGKAANLKQRLQQYFSPSPSPVVRRLLEQSHAVDFVLTGNSGEALQLEYNFVHHYRPAFNVRLKDDKSYPVVEITLGQDYPGVYFARRPREGSFVSPPLVDAGKARAMIDLIMRVFRLRNCGDAAFRRGIPCLYYHIQRCSAPCAFPDQREDYLRRARDAVAFLRGRRAQVVRRLEREMQEHALGLRFEQAQHLKEGLQVLRDFPLRSVVAARTKGAYDAVALHMAGEEAAVLRFPVESGHAVSRDFFTFSTLVASPAEAMEEFLLTFFHKANLPGNLVVDPLPVQAEDIERLFSDLAGHKVTLRAPQRGPRRQMLDLVRRNLGLYVNRERFDTVAAELRDALGLAHLPMRIEGVDISHFAGAERVGAVVVFENGRPLTSEYRNYVIREAPAGDTLAIREVLERRFSRDPAPDPDLLLIDGGRDQLRVALDVKTRLKFRADVISLAKAEERVYAETGVTTVFPPGSPLRFLLQNVRDEAHRRAVTHHRKRRSRKIKP